MEEELCWMSATEIAARIAAHELSPVEVVDAVLARAGTVDERIASFVTVDEDGARESARVLAERLRRGETPGPLAGVPVSVKDLTPVLGVRCTFGSALARDFVAPLDEALVTRLREAGAVLIGKTNTPELGTKVTTDNLVAPVTRNPWDLSRTSGGSSGGASAAVAAGLGPLAEGSDGAGSIRIPSACCGVVGLKPARGRVSMAPLLGEAWAGFATSGPIARNVADAALMLDVIAGYESGDPYWAPPPAEPFARSASRRPRGLRLALALEAPGVATDAEVAAAVEEAARCLEGLGHRVEAASPPVSGMGGDYELVFAASVAGLPFEDLVGSEIDDAKLTDWVRWLRERGRRLGADHYVAALTRLHALARILVGFFDGFDALLTPTLVRPAERLDWDPGPFETVLAEGWFHWCPFTYPFNVTGQPAISLPCGFSSKGLPIGLQIVGRPGDEATVLALAGAYEEAATWARRRPPCA